MSKMSKILTNADIFFKYEIIIIKSLPLFKFVLKSLFMLVVPSKG